VYKYLMAATSTPAQITATAKREVREALRFAGFAADVTASTRTIKVHLFDAADRPAVLRMYPDATACRANPSVVYLAR
jgi:hypothetical protein